jgi:hypothetical protein
MLNLVFFFITLSHGRYLVCVIWNSKSVQLILFKLCTVFIYILNEHTKNVWTKLSNLPIIGGAHLQYVHKHCAKFKYYWLNMVSVQSILFKLCMVFGYILKMCTSYYGQIWRFFSYIFCMLNLVIFYHYMTLTVSRWCNLKL